MWFLVKGLFLAFRDGRKSVLSLPFLIKSLVFYSHRDINYPSKASSLNTTVIVIVKTLSHAVWGLQFSNGFFLRGQQLRNRYFRATGNLRFQGIYVSLIPSVTTQIAFQQRKLRGANSAPELCLTWVAIHPLPLPFPTLPLP